MHDLNAKKFKSFRYRTGLLFLIKDDPDGGCYFQGFIHFGFFHAISDAKFLFSMSFCAPTLNPISILTKGW